MSVKHPRQMIREAVRDALAGKTDVGNRIYLNRATPFTSRRWEDNLPAIVVYTLDESAELSAAAPLEYQRTVQVAVEILSRADDDLDDVLDTIARQVELSLILDDSLGGACNALRYSSTQMVLKPDGDDLFGGCRILFTAEYFDEQPTRESVEVLDDLKRIRTEYSLDNDQPEGDRAVTDIKGLDQ